MSRLRPLTPDGIAAFGGACSSCVYWESDEPLDVRCGAACDEERLRAWFSEVHREWGECGRMARQNDAVLGFIKYAPARYFPQTAYLPVGAPDVGSPLITCLHVEEDSRSGGVERVLLQAALRDLHQRGERSVYAYGCAPCDSATSPLVDLEFLLENGFVIERPHLATPLLRLDLRTLAAWTENLEAALESLLRPLGRARRVATPSVD